MSGVPPCAVMSYFSADIALISRVTFCSASVVSTWKTAAGVSAEAAKSAAIRLRATAYLFPEVLQHVLTTPAQVGLQQHRVPLLIVHGLGDLAAQEPEEKMANAFALHGGSRKEGRKKR